MATPRTQQKILFIIEDEEETCDNCKENGSNADNFSSDSYYNRNKQLFKDRYQTNAESKRAYQSDYNLINSEKYSAYQKSYYEKRREKLLESKKEKVLCECGKMVSIGHLTCHKKTSIHIKRMNSMTK